jgi:FKBP-type peptidyl-prolyl cis-trans isomerase SlyD
MAARVVSFHYTLKNKNGDVLDSSLHSRPMTFLEGSGQIIPGLERVMLLLGVGDKREVKIPAIEAYGEYDASLRFDVPLTQFPKDHGLKVGDMFRAGPSEEESRIFQVVALTDTHASLDGNHPLAGQDLFFSIEVIATRAATPEEIAHGHVHGQGDHHH